MKSEMPMNAKTTCEIGIIWFVVAVDIYWTIHNADMLIDFELNPLALCIIKSYGVGALCAIKVFNTYIVTEILRRLPQFYTRIIAVLALILLGILML
jgi:hypothetical protein